MENNLPELTEENFKKLSQPACVVFAWRAAMRVLPVLGGQEGNLDFWAEADRRRNLAAVLAALDEVLPWIGFVEGGISKYVAASVVDAVANVIPAGYVSYTYAVGAAVAAVSGDAYEAYKCAAFTSTVRRGDTLADFVFGAYADAAKNVMQWDLYLLLQWQKATPTCEVVFAPLWQIAEGGGLPDGWLEITDRWQQVMREYGHSDFCDSYLGLLEGRPWDVEASLRRFEDWIASRKDNKHGESGDVEGITITEKPETITLVLDDLVAQASVEDVEMSVGSKPVAKKSSAGIATALADEPSKHDSLGRTPIVNTLANMLASPEQTLPMTIALLGDWGAGKSSMIDQLQLQLNKLIKDFDNSWTLVSERDRNEPLRPYAYIHATFNAWEYEKTDNIRAGLAQEVVNGLVDDMYIWQKFGFSFLNAWCQHRWQFVWSVLGVVVTALAVLYGVSSNDLGLNTFSETFLGVGAAAAMSFVLYKSWKTAVNILEHPLVSRLQTYLKLPSYGEHLGLVPVIKQQIETLCKLRLKGLYRHRLLVVVDDLDRCSPECITETLDAIRLVMNLKDVAVLIAIDDRVAFRAVAEHYKKLSDHDRPSAAIARDYLGKIIQLPINLPKPAAGDLSGFIANQLFPQIEADSVDGSAVAPVVEASLPHVSSSSAEPKDEKQKPLPVTGSLPEEDEPDVAKSVRAKSKRSMAEMQSLMVDLREELEQFQKLARDLDFTNPRQLTRLKNSYRVLKGINHLSDREDSSIERRGLMLGMFWAEYLFQFPLENKVLPEQGRRHIELALLDAIAKESVPVVPVIKNMSDDFSDWLQVPFEGKSRRLYFELMQRVSVTVLSSAEGGLLLSREAMDRYKSMKAE